VTDLIARSDRVIVDIGTGDGRAVLARAAAEPRALVIGVDAAAAAMTDASRRAARRGPTNALFFAAGAEELHATPLAERAGLVTISFPWGSLLRGVLGLDPAVLAGVAALPCNDTTVEVLASVVPDDHVAGLDRLDATLEPSIRVAWQAAGLELCSMRRATAAEIEASGSSWARRLRTAQRASGHPAAEEVRPVWRLVGRRLG
jgi:16S rRNA (adenine(1408)-N(1))-methyltransferase